MTILVVGASVSGVAVVRTLRRLGCTDRIVMIEAEGRMPYDKPPISKSMLMDTAQVGDVALLTTLEIGELEVDLRLATRAVRLDPERHILHTDLGEKLHYDQIVIATGAGARSLPAAGKLLGVRTLRTADDAIAVREGLQFAQRVVAVGGGFIGQELASVAHSYGCSIAIVEQQKKLHLEMLGPYVADEIEDLHRQHDVELVTGTSVIGFEGEGRVSHLLLDSGKRLEADLVVVGIGAVPTVDWLAGTGVDAADGLECDADMRILNLENCWAVGDIARWHHPYFESAVRVEHWTNANETAEIAAASMIGAPRPKSQPPYVWSDQYGRRLQIIGRPQAARRAITRQARVGGTTAAAYVNEDGRIVGGLAFEDPKTLMRLRRAVIAGTRIDEFDAAKLGLINDVSWRAAPDRSQGQGAHRCR